MLDDIIQTGLTFDDVLLLPARSEVLPKEVNIATYLTRNIQINIPIVSAAMDTVTEADLAIAIAREGGIGMIHRAMSPERQKIEVDKVKFLDRQTPDDDQFIQQEIESWKKLAEEERNKFEFIKSMPKHGFFFHNILMA